MNKRKETLQSASGNALKREIVPGVQAQPINRTELNELTLDEREVRIKEKIRFKAICRQCQTEMPQLLNRGLTLVDSETILAKYKCQELKKPVILFDECERQNSSRLTQETNQSLTKIQGILTSNLRTRKSSEVPYMAFLWLEHEEGKDSYSAKHCQWECERIKCKDCEIPVIFRIRGEMREWLEPIFKKGDRVILEGKWTDSKKSNRPSFTCYSYKILEGVDIEGNLIIMGAINKNMQGISFEKGKELLTNFPCSQCQLYLTEQDIKQENYSFWLSDNEITRKGSCYQANFWLKGVDHLECLEKGEDGK